MWEYTDKVKEHFMNPKNVGEIEDADGIGEVGSIACGDALKLMFNLNDEKKIEEVKFQTFGCASAIASSSALTEMLKGLTIEEAGKITNDDIADFLGGLPKEKMHCSVMGRDALEKAIAYYQGESEKEREGEIVCECFGVTDVEIKRAVTENNLKSIEDVTAYVKAGGGCENCHEKIQEIIDSTLGISVPEKKKVPEMTNIQKIRLIEEVLENEIRPMLKKDRGNIKLIDFIGNDVVVEMRGACSNCGTSQFTIKHFVEDKLREHVSPDLNVKEV
ncbi:MAG: Fe-S cluster assembly protein NifU [Deltaproteobacteria bacterium]|nr:Fe-S cluster assembly protein NifU [Deltaproteobacteria bacterium]